VPLPYIEGMPIERIAEVVLETLNDHKPHDVGEVVRDTAKQTSSYPADVKSAVLGLLRRQKVQMTDDFKVKLP
jgi:hypothetical protein